jgi:CheY-like chemotaxis protein
VTALILVVDDDVIVRETVTRMLEEGGYRVLSAENGEQALTIFRAERPDLVVTDIVMPVLGGIESIIALYQDHPTARILAMSGGGHVQGREFLRLAKALGVTGILAKPFTATDFLERVARCLKER